MPNEPVFNPDGTNNIFSVVGDNNNIPESPVVMPQTYNVPSKTGETPVESMFNIGDFSRQYLDNQDAKNEADKLFAAQFPDDPSTGALPSNVYYPGIDDPILKGMSSSKTLGSQPVFVRSGGYFPFGVMDERKKVLQTAAAERAKQLRAFDMPTPPLVKEARFQEDLSNKFFNSVEGIIKEAESLYGKEKGMWMLQNDPSNPLAMKFNLMKDNYKTLGREIDQVTDKLAEVDLTLKDKSMAWSPETLKLRKEAETLTGRFLNGEMDVEVRKNYNNFLGSMELDKYLNQNVLKNLEAEVNEAWGGFKSDGDINTARSFKKTSFDNIARKYAKEAKKHQYADDYWYTEDDIYNRIKAMKGDKLESEMKALNKPTERIKGYDVQDEKDLSPVKTKTLTWNDADGKTNNGMTITKAVELQEGKNPIEVSGAILYRPDGSEIPMDKNSIIKFRPTTLGDWKNQSGKTRQVVAGYYETETIEDGKTIKEQIPVVMDLYSQRSEIRNHAPKTFDYFDKNSNVKVTDEELNTVVKTNKTTTTPEKKATGVTLNYDEINK